MKMLGRIHSSYCDCNSKYVTAQDEKCNKKYGTKRQRSKEKRSWKTAARHGDTP